MSDLLLRRVRLVPIIPTDRAADHPVDVLIQSGTVTQIGTDLSLPTTIESYDGAGRYLAPGLWDAHVHLGQWSEGADRVDTSGLKSAEEAVRLVADLAHRAPGKPIIGWGHRPATWTRQGTVAELDSAAGSTPVVLVAGDAHHAWLNSAGLAALGLPPTQGPVAEGPWYAAYPRLAELNQGSTTDRYRLALRRAAALGVVGLVDFEFGGDVEGWRSRWSEGCDLLRVRAAVYADSFPAVRTEGLRTGDRLLPDEPRLTLGPLKVISDGSLNTRTAWCHTPYLTGAAPDHPHGAPNLSADALIELMTEAHAHGFEVATHAIGDAALDQALTAYDATGARGSIEHAQLVTQDAVARMAGLPLTASVQPHHLVDDRDLSEQTWADRTDRCFAFRWMSNAGIPLALGSDAPVSPLDPWLAIDAAVRRTGDDRPAWHPEQALSRPEALAASTDGRTMVSRGAPADLIVLDEDPRTHARPPVVLTLVAGQVVHRA